MSLTLHTKKDSVSVRIPGNLTIAYLKYMDSSWHEIKKEGDQKKAYFHNKQKDL